MAKKPDFDLGSITKKMNIGGIMDNVKSMISSTDNNIEPQDGDVIGALLAQLHTQAQEASATYKEQAKQLEALANTASQIYAALEAERAPAEDVESTDTTATEVEQTETAEADTTAPDDKPQVDATDTAQTEEKAVSKSENDTTN
jgi:hypothetical protein